VAHAAFINSISQLGSEVRRYLPFRGKMTEGVIRQWLGRLMDLDYILQVTNVNSRLAWENIFWQI